MQIDKINIYRYSNPLEKPIQLMGREFNERQGLLIELCTSTGLKSYGDICPFPGINSETIEEIVDFFPEIIDELLSIDFEDFNTNFYIQQKKKSEKYQSMNFGIECAVLDLYAQSKNLSFSELFSIEPNKSIQVSKLITLDENIRNQINTGIDKGYKSFKIKIDRNSISDTLLVLRSYRNAGISFRLDANRTFHYDEIIDKFQDTDSEFIEYIEEPICKLDSIDNLFNKLNDFYDRTGIGIALDETILEINDYSTLTNQVFIKALIIKPVAIGSINKILDLFYYSKKAKISFIVSSVLESEIGMKHIAYLCSGLRLYDNPMGLDTYKYFSKSSDNHYSFLSEPEIVIEELVSINASPQKDTLSLCFVRFEVSYNAVIFDNTLSYEMLLRKIKSAVSSLSQLGIKNGDRVAVHLENSIEYIIIFWACQRLGATAVLLNYRQPKEQVAGTIKDICCKLIISNDLSDDEFGIPCKSTNEIITDYIMELDSNSRSFFHSFAKDMHSSIIFTSGSSGRSKGVLHTYGNHYYNALGSNSNVLLNSNDRWLLSLPLYHVGGLAILFRCFLSGAGVVIEDKSISIIDNIKKYSITHVSLVPTQLYRILQQKNGKVILKKLKYILIGGGPISQSLIDQCSANEINLHISYGSTEMASQIVTYSTSNNNDNTLIYRDFAIIDDEVVVKGKCLAKGYIEKGELFDFRDDNGWFHTNDIGSIDDKGKLTILGRKDNMFISGGENIQPEEIESAIRDIDGVIEVLVVPVNDLEYGQRPIAFIDSEKEINYDSVRATLKRQLASYKIPIAFYPFPSDIKQSGIKTSRKTYKDIAEATHKAL